MAKRALVALGLLAITAACGGDDDEPPCAAVGTGARGYDALGYRLTARFDWDTQTLTAREELTVACRAQAQLTFDAEVDVATVTIAGQPAPFSVDAAAHTLTVDTGGTSGPVTIEIAYTAPVSDALRVGGPRDDDPVPSRIAFTDSEPDRGRRWLIAKHDPADRATFAVELTMPTEHDAIANGERTVDRAAGAERVVGYALDQPIPTYLMAFATGPLERVERTTGRVPLAVWYRRGLPVDGEAHLDLLEELMTTFEVRLGQYPWSRYAVVLLPQFGGGMENATITFNNETSGLGALGVNLNAHELAHQWFGDWVTMHTYDDVWVKEGMATMLAAEAEVARRDRAEVGRWFGSDFAFNVDDAVVDTNLTGLAKYTSGPYQRSAWLMTQLRRRIGDDAFWAGARKLLADRALGTATGAQFLASFTPALDDTTMAQALASLPVHGAPSIAVAVSAGAGGTTLGFTLDDPDRLLLAPIEVGAVDATGAAAPLAALPTTVVVPDGGYLALDPDGVHPYWPYVFGPWATYFDQVEPRLSPRTEGGPRGPSRAGPPRSKSAGCTPVCRSRPATASPTYTRASTRPRPRPPPRSPPAGRYRPSASPRPRGWPPRSARCCGRRRSPASSRATRPVRRRWSSRCSAASSRRWRPRRARPTPPASTTCSASTTARRRPWRASARSRPPRPACACASARSTD
jgi:aminopeptidase N